MFLINNSFSNPSSATGENLFTEYTLPDWATGLPESQGAPHLPQALPPADVFGGDGEFDLLAESTASTGEVSPGSIVLGSIDPLTGAIGSSGGGFEDGLSGLPATPDPVEGVSIATTMAMGEETSDTLLWCWLPPIETFPAPIEEPATTEEPLMGGVDPWFPDWTDINSCCVVDGRLWGGQPLNPQPPEILEPISEGTNPVDSEGSTVLPVPDVPTPVPIQPIVPSSDLPDPLSEEPGISDPLVNTTIPAPIKKPFPTGDDFVITTMALGEEGDAGCGPP
jgi:hypothetical protein